MMLKFCALLAVFIVVIKPIDGQSKSCRAVISDMNKQQLDKVNQCVKELGFKSGRERTQKSGCVMLCVLRHLNLLNKEGTFDQDQMDTFLTEQFPIELQERVNATMQPCLKLAPPPNSVQDEFCKGYDPLVKCVSRSFFNICK